MPLLPGPFVAVPALVLLLSAGLAACTQQEQPAAPATETHQAVHPEALPHAAGDVGEAGTTEAGTDATSPSAGGESPMAVPQTEVATPPPPAHPFAHTRLTPREDFRITVADADLNSTAFHIEFELVDEAARAFHIDSDIFLLYGDVKLHLRGINPVERNRDEDGHIASLRFVYSGAVVPDLQPHADVPVAVLMDNRHLSTPAVWQPGPFEPVR